MRVEQQRRIVLDTHAWSHRQTLHPPTPTGHNATTTILDRYARSNTTTTAPDRDPSPSSNTATCADDVADDDDNNPNNNTTTTTTIGDHTRDNADHVHTLMSTNGRTCWSRSPTNPILGSLA
jgi:hypothetical protein